MSAIDAELALQEERVSEEVVQESNGFKVVSIGLGRHVVKDPDDNVLTSVPVPKEQAMLLLKALVPKSQGDGKKEPKDSKSVEK